MLKKIADNREVDSLAVQFRKKRFAFFSSLLSKLDRPVSILDIGGTETYWKTMGMEGYTQVFITLLEPHFLFPFFQFLPVSLRVGLLKNFDLGWFKRTPESEKAKEVVEGIRLLNKREFRELFPNSKLYEEKILWMTKSFVAYEGWDD